MHLRHFALLFKLIIIINDLITNLFIIIYLWETKLPFVKIFKKVFSVQNVHFRVWKVASTFFFVIARFQSFFSPLKYISASTNLHQQALRVVGYNKENNKL